MNNANNIEMALEKAWHRNTAETSLERWSEICTKENWGDVPEDISRLIAVFGASWYFTRFVFYRGLEIVPIIDDADIDISDADTIAGILMKALDEDGEERQFEALRQRKNELMLVILLRRFGNTGSLSSNEAALTILAIETLAVALRISGLELENNECQLAILGMGRMAGREMTFGSDLDLIFLYSATSDEQRMSYAQKIRFLLRNMASSSASGMLYEIDMRLRPHGTSGALITSTSSFLDYHMGERDCWERQMMTRCHASIDYQGIGIDCLKVLEPIIYQKYPVATLSSEILSMRLRVEEELGSRRGKHDIKRDEGGIMDIDFITHFLQLKYGFENPDLRKRSTRVVLAEASQSGYLQENEAQTLLSDYDYFKTLETCLRLFDMKSISSFATHIDNDHALVRALEFSGTEAATLFLDDFDMRRRRTRITFLKTLDAS